MVTTTALGFDFGLRHIGVAVGQTVTMTATPLAVIQVGVRGLDWPAIAKLITTWSPDTLVVGLPLNMDGSEQEISKRARRFARQLNGRFRLPVHLRDERLSTREARARLVAGNEPKTSEHAVAAQVILESWLQEVQNEPRDNPPQSSTAGAPPVDPPVDPPGDNPGENPGDNPEGNPGGASGANPSKPNLRGKS